MPHGIFARKRRAFPCPHGFFTRDRRAGTPFPARTASSQGSAAPFPGRMAFSQGSAAPSPGSLASSQGNAMPSCPPFLTLPGSHARKRRAGSPAFASYGFPRKGAPRLSLATQRPRKEAQRPSLATRLPCKEEPRLLKRPSSRRAASPQGNVVPFPGSLASLQGSASPRLPFPRRNRPRGSLAPRGLLRLPLAWHVFSEGAVALGLRPALAVLLPSLGEELIQ